MAGCGGCAARRAALEAGKISYIWTSDDGEDTVTYSGPHAKIKAEAKVMRKGGSFVPKQG